MALEQGLWMLLAQTTNVTNAVGTDANNQPQIYWVQAPKSTNATMGFIVLTLYHTDDFFTFQGSIGTRCAYIQVDCYSTTYYNSAIIALAVRQALTAYTGNLPDSSSTPVLATFTENDRDFPYEEGYKGFIYRRMLEFKVFYSETPLSISDDLGGTLVVGGEV